MATIEYDSWLEMWWVQFVEQNGTVHRRWFHTEQAARDWLAHWEAK